MQRFLIVTASRLARLLLFPVLRKIRLGGYLQVLNPSDNASLNIFAQREGYERSHVDLFLSYVCCNPSAIVLDIGANYGQYSLAAANIGRYGTVKRIIAFEPDSVPFRCLEQSVDINHFAPFFLTIRAIVGEKKGVGEIFKSESSSLSNRSFISSSEALVFKSAEKCRIVSIDDILDEKGISPQEHKFVIKIDIEGNEPKAFRGAHKLLEHAKGYFVQFEYYPFAMIEVSEDPASFRVLLSTLSFDTVLRVEGDRVRAITRKQLFETMQALDAKARPTVADNFIILKNFRHPDFVRYALQELAASQDVLCKAGENTRSGGPSP